MEKHSIAAELVYQLAEYGVEQVFGITEYYECIY